MYEHRYRTILNAFVNNKKYASTQYRSYVFIEM